VSANVPSGQGRQCNSPTPRFHPFRFQPGVGSDTTYAFPEAKLEGHAPPTRVRPITPDFSNLSVVREVPTISHVERYEIRDSGDCPKRIPQMGMGPAQVSISRGPTSLGRSPSALEATKGPYTCKDCGKGYTQSQGLSRHRREMHKPKLCTLCGTFKWGRRYLLKRHVKRDHPELDADKALDEATRAYTVAIITSRCSTLRQILLAELELNPRSYGDSQAEASRTKCKTVKMGAVPDIPGSPGGQSCMTWGAGN
jgi:hypothetical protein